jgi:hypothetical protein
MAVDASAVVTSAHGFDVPAETGGEVVNAAAATATARTYEGKRRGMVGDCITAEGVSFQVVQRGL